MFTFYDWPCPIRCYRMALLIIECQWPRQWQCLKLEAWWWSTLQTRLVVMLIGLTVRDVEIGTTWQWDDNDLTCRGPPHSMFPCIHTLLDLRLYICETVSSDLYLLGTQSGDLRIINVTMCWSQVQVCSWGKWLIFCSILPATVSLFRCVTSRSLE